MLKNYIRLASVVSMVFLLCGTVKAYIYTAGDWDGQEPPVADGGYLSGAFASPVPFTSSRSALIYNEASPHLEFQAWNIDLRRTIVFPHQPGSTLPFFSDDYITLYQGMELGSPGDACLGG